MPDVRMPNGTVIKNVPEGITQAQLLSRLGGSGYDTKTLLQPKKEAAGFTGSFSDAIQTLGLTDEAASFASDPSEKNRRAFLKAAESKYRQVGFGEGENWEAFKQLLGSSLGQLAAPVAAGLGASAATTPIGGLIAAGSTGFTQYGTQNLLRQAQAQEEAVAAGQKPQAVSLGKAALASAGQTALDLAGGRVFSGIAKAFPFMRPLLGQAGGKAATEAGEVLADAAKKGTITFAGGVARGVGKGVAFEVPQEIAQQGLERWQAGLSLTDDEAREEYGQAAIGALILGGGFGAVEGAISRPRNVPTAEREGDSEGFTDEIRKGVLTSLTQAAGPDLSRDAKAGVDAVERIVSNAVASGKPEDIEAARKFIQDREDDADAGSYDEPLANALRRPVLDEAGKPATDEKGRPVYEGIVVEARRILDDISATKPPTANTSRTVVDIDGQQSIIETPATYEGVQQLATALGNLAPTTVPPIDRTSILGLANERYPDNDLSATAFYNGALGVEPDAAFRAAASDIEKQAFEEGRAYAQQQQPEATPPSRAAGVSLTEGLGASVPPAAGPELGGATVGEPAGDVPRGVDGNGVPPVPPSVDETAQPNPLEPEPTGTPQRTELKAPPEWLVKLADRFGMSAPLDAWTQTNLGYETLPEALQTGGKLELLTTQKAGKERNLQRNWFDPIVNLAGNLGVDLADLGYFLWARSAADRNRIVAETNPENFPEGGSGLTTAQAAAGLRQLEAEGKLPKLNQIARKVDELVDFVLNERVKAGLISAEEAKQQREAQPFYVPLKGFAQDGDMMSMEVDEDAGAVSRQTEAARALRATLPSGALNEFRKAFGRGSVPFHPLFNLFEDAEQSVRRNLNNQAMQPLLRVWKKDPSIFEGILNVYTDRNPKRVMMGRGTLGGRWEPVPDMKKEYYANRDKYLVVKDNGVTHYIEFAEKGAGADLRRMFSNMNSQDLEGALKNIATVNNFMKGMLTYKNPLYLLFVAPLRDTSAAIATALANQNIKGSPAYKKNLAAKTFFYSLPFTGTWSAIARYVFGKAPMDDATGKLLEEMIDAGGATLHTRFLNVEEKASAAARAVRSMRGLGETDTKDLPARLWEGLNYWIDGLADIMDMSARFATYRAATDLGIQPADAARLALDSSLNLTRRGEMARNLDLIVPFFGAGVEASRKTARILTNPKALAKVFGSMIALGVLESMWNSAQSGDDDDDGQENYLDQDLGAGLRMSRLIIYYGEGADDYIKVPIDPMLGYFKFVGNKIGDVMAGTISPSEASTGLVPGFISLMSPLRVPGTDVQSLTTAVTPLVGKPFVENIFNENFFGSPIYKERTFDSAPRSELGRDTTGAFWKGLAKVINDATGGSAAVSGGVDFQPEVYRHIIESYFGGPYQLGKQLAGLKEAEGVADVPGIKSFVGTGSEYAPQSKYFNNTTVVRQIMNRLNKLTPEQQAAQGAEFYMDTDPRIITAYKAVEANLDRINKEQKASLKLANNDADKKVVLDYYRAQKNEYYSAFNSVYNAVKTGE